MNEQITEYIQDIKLPWQAEVCEDIRQMIHQRIPDVQERLQYKKPHFLKNGRYAAVLGTAKGWVSFTIFNATSLEAPEGFFEPSDVSDRQTIKIREGQPVDYDLLGRLIKQASDTL